MESFILVNLSVLNPTCSNSPDAPTAFVPDVRAESVLVAGGPKFEPPDELVIEAEIEILGKKVGLPTPCRLRDDKWAAERYYVELIDLGFGEYLLAPSKGRGIVY
jgi:hypothetical protein